MREEWKKIPFAPGYEISNHGRVKNRIEKKYNNAFGKIKNPHITKSGYDNVCLIVNGRAKTFGAHRLVYAVFKGDIPSGYYVHHIDNNKLNNRVDNLKVVTPSENCKHALADKRKKILKGEDAPGSKLTEKDVKEIRKLLQEGRLLQKEIGKMYGVANNTICGINRRHTWKHLK